MMTDEREEQTILAVLGVLEGAPLAVEGADESEETVGRLYVEVLGLLAYQDPPHPPSSALKTRLMTAITVAPAGEVQSSRKLSHEVEFTLTEEGPETAGTAPTATLRSRRLPRAPLPEPIPLREEFMGPVRRSVPPPVVRPARPRSWVRPLALAAAAAIVVLLGIDGWLTSQFLGQRDAIAQLSEQLLNERGERVRRSALAATAVHDLNAMRRNFSLVTSREVLAAGLKPMGTPSPLQPAAHGILFVAADHQHWYLAIAGLTPSNAGACYQVWFISPDGPQNAGTFHVSSTSPIELSSPQMPVGTREVWITVEPATGSKQPTGPQVLAGAQFQVL
jgi:hypothetical protein